MFDILLLELEPVCTAEQEFVQKFFDFTLDEPEVCVFGHIVDYVQFVFLCHQICSCFVKGGQ